MALSKTLEIKAVDISDTWNISIRTDTVVSEDGLEISRSPHRKTIVPFQSNYNGSKWTHTLTDISGEDSTVQSIATAAWTTTVKNNYKTWAEANLKAPGS